MYQHFTHWGKYKAGISHGGQWPQGPTLLMDGHLRIPPKLCIPHPHSLISLHSWQFPLPWLAWQLLGYTPQACKPWIAQPQDRRTSSKTATAISIVWCTGEPYEFKARSWNNTSLCPAATLATQGEGGYHL